MLCHIEWISYAVAWKMETEGNWVLNIYTVTMRMFSFSWTLSRLFFLCVMMDEKMWKGTNGCHEIYSKQVINILIQTLKLDSTTVLNAFTHSIPMLMLFYVSLSRITRKLAMMMVAKKQLKIDLKLFSALLAELFLRQWEFFWLEKCSNLTTVWIGHAFKF